MHAQQNKMKSWIQHFLLISKIIIISFWNFAHSTTYCPPLLAPQDTNLTCITSLDEQLVDCASTWLPDGSAAYFRCKEDDKLRIRFGKIICKGNYEMINDKPLEISNKEKSGELPCGIHQMPNNSDFHFFGFEKSQHYPLLINATNKSDFRIGGLELINAYRRQHGSEPLEMDHLLNKKAQLWAETLSQRSSLDLSSENLVGQNIFNSDQSDILFAVNDAIQFWYLQGKANYNWEDVTSNWDNSLALDFSQIVWKSTRKLGLSASSRKFPADKNGTVVVAFYYPIGNVVLENEPRPDQKFLENVLKPIENTSMSKI